MASVDGSTRRSIVATRGPRRPLRRAVGGVGRSVNLETRLAVLLGAVALVVAVLVSFFPVQTPFTSLALPLVLGSIVLGPRTLPWFVIFVLALLTFCLYQQVEITPKTVGAAAVQFGIGLVILLMGLRRARLGVAGIRGEAMLVDLRDRILHQGGTPQLPSDWRLDRSLRSAGGTAFAGDFVVTAGDGETLQVVVVDVSGKGVEAGTRALLLSGALGGLLGSLPREEFLPAANAYLLRQDWDEGFATAVHLWADLTTGRVEVRTAGHPPAAHRAGSGGGWTVLDSEGPLLGLLPDPDFRVATAELGAGGAVVLYTDGMVEEPRCDIDQGIERLLAEAGPLLDAGRVGAADTLTARLGSRADDRAVVVVRHD